MNAMRVEQRHRVNGFSIYVRWHAASILSCYLSPDEAQQERPAQFKPTCSQRWRPAASRSADPVYAKVETEWKSPACDLRKGAILKGRIVSQTVRSKTQKTSDVASACLKAASAADEI